MSLSAAQAQSPPRSSSTYTEYEVIKALDEWVFDAYKITQPVHQKIIRYWARRINNNSKMRRQIRQGETVGVKDATTADKVECCVKVVEECRRLAKRSGLLTYQRRHNQIGVWVMYFSCMIKPPPAEKTEDDDGVITGVFDQAQKDETESSQVHQSPSYDSHLLEDTEVENADSNSVSEIDADLVQKQVYKNYNTTTIELRNSITDHANDESAVAEESKELIKDSYPEANQFQTELFEVWKLNRIRNKCGIAQHNHQKHYEQIADVVEWAIEMKYCTKDDATLKLRPIFDKVSGNGFTVPIGLIRSPEGRQLFTDAFPAQESTKLSPNDPGYYDQDAMDETRNRNKEKARQVRERGAAYGFSKTDKPAPETTPEPVEETKKNGNGGGGSMSPTDRKAWLREAVPGLNNVQADKKSSFGNATEVTEETKKKIRETQATQMDLFDLPVSDNE